MKKKQVRATTKTRPRSKQPMERAMVDFDKAMEEIRPFIKTKKTKTYSTAWGWTASDFS